MWKVIDVYLSGTISELAERSTVRVTPLQRRRWRGCATIEQKTAALRTG